MESEIRTDAPLLKTAFAKLGAAWPQGVHFGDVLRHAMAELGRAGAEDTATDTDVLASALVRAQEAGFVEFRTHQPRFVTELGERPRASALAQLQLALGDRVTTMLHSMVQIDDPLGRELLRVMDGTRDRAALKSELKKLPAAKGVTVTDEALEENLRKLARMALVEK